jgi:hypothetical protein
LIFQSDKGELDTSIIIKKELFYPEYNPIEVHGTYLPQWGVVWYKNKNLEYHPEGYRLISLAKERPNKTSLSIDYLYGGALVLNLSNASIEKIKKGEVYEFDTYHPKGQPNQPRTLYWQERLGVIGYITHNSSRWRLLNRTYKAANTSLPK